jgi:WD40 repeat protein
VPRCATSNAIRRAPHRGWARRSSHTSASVSAASRDGEVRGRRETSRSPSTPAAACRAFHEYTDCRDTPYRMATSLTGDPSRTSSTAPVPLLDQPALVFCLLLACPHEQEIIEITDSNCQACPDYEVSSVSWGLTRQRLDGADLTGADLLATADAGHVTLWDLDTGAAVATLTGHEDPVRAVAFSPDGTRLASGGNDGTVRLWDPVTGTAVATITGHKNPVRAVAFSPDGTRLASGGNGSGRITDIGMLRVTSLRARCSHGACRCSGSGGNGVFGDDRRVCAASFVRPGGTA